MISKNFYFLLLFLTAYVSSDSETKNPHGYKRIKPSGAVINEEEKTAEYWNQMAENELNDNLNVIANINNGKAKNVILFIGDGMGIPTLTAARILKGQLASPTAPGEEGALEFEGFPHVALSKTYNVDMQIPDSAGTGTAYVTGVKANEGTLGVTATVSRFDCEASKIPSNQLDSFLQWFIDDGRNAGLVTTTRITHATPASTYAHSAHREWECDDFRPWPEDPPEAVLPENCEDIATQLVNGKTGKGLKVIFGGGRHGLDGTAPTTSDDPKSTCKRKTASGSLIQTWLEMHSSENAVYAQNRTELLNLNPEKVGKVLGLFANSHMPYVYEKDASTTQKEIFPTLPEMTRKAIEILQSDGKGFALLVEGGRIDTAHHETRMNAALLEVLEMDEAVQVALSLTNPEETLIIVTADHSHTMSFGGYGARGSPVSETSGVNDDDQQTPFLKMAYANGPRVYSYSAGSRPEPGTPEEIVSPQYQPFVPVKMLFETHGGEEVAIYAKGPRAHLFQGLHEQNYIAHVMGYASCTGRYKGRC